MISGRTVTRSLADGTVEEVKLGWVQELPGPVQTWEKTRKYVVEPFAKREELDQGILRFTWYSLVIVAKGYAIALILGTPLGFLLGLSATFSKMFDPIIQVLRPVSPLAWMPLGVVLFANAGKSANELVLNTAVGVRAIPQDYLNVARVLKLSRTQTLFRIMIPATLPYMFTGYRLSLGIAWLVIVAVEMLTGRIGIGNFLWNEYNNGLYTSIVLCIVTIGLVGFALDRAMSLLERRFKSIL
jgi:nitrate/nitrite transport system permease protein